MPTALSPEPTQNLTPRSLQQSSLASGRWFAVCWVSLWALLSSAWCITSARHLGATFDEPIYIKEGLEAWRTGSTAGLMKLGTMPLPVDIQTLPLYLWENWRGRPIDPVAEFHTVLPYARAATLLFWWLLLVHAWLAARSLGGPWAAAIAVAFLACEPCLASHAALATTDIAVTACLLALVYHFQASREKAWWGRIAWPGLWFAAAVLAKASGLVFGCLCLFLVEAQRCGWWRRPDSPRFRDSWKDLFQIGLIGMVLVFAYCGSDWQPQKSFLKWAHGLPEGFLSTVMVWLAEHLRIFSNAGDGIMRQVTHNVRGHGAYLLGQTHRRALWYYFPVVLAIKLSVPLLFAPFAVALVRLWKRGPSVRANWALLCAAALLAFSLTCRVQIGVRFMFPLVALGVVGLAAALVQATVAWPLRARRAALAVTAGCLLWTAASAAAVWPDGICYVNPLWGGTREGYRLVSEANYDWGQGLKELTGWQQKHPGEELYVWYFGTDPAFQTLPVLPLPLHALPAHSPADILQHLRGHRVAISTTLAHGCVPGPSMPYVHAVLHAHRPIARTTTFLIYDFTDDTARKMTR
jgi:4-amino-4-deoxy-L-arabinose transferase-like glycosyltransferase